MLVNSLGHGFGQRMLRMTCPCSLMSVPWRQLGRHKSWGWLEQLGGWKHLQASSLTCHMGWLKEGSVSSAHWVTCCHPLQVTWPLTAWQLGAKREHSKTTRWKPPGLFSPSPGIQSITSIAFYMVTSQSLRSAQPQVEEKRSSPDGGGGGKACGRGGISAAILVRLNLPQHWSATHWNFKNGFFTTDSVSNISLEPERTVNS